MLKPKKKPVGMGQLITSIRGKVQANKTPSSKEAVMDSVEYRLSLIETNLERLLTVIEKLEKEIHSSQKIEQQYYTLRDAVKLKYGNTAAYTTISTNYALMPCCNKNYKVMAGKRVWTAPQIKEWLLIEDKDIPKYAEKYGVQLTGRIREKYKKYM